MNWIVIERRCNKTKHRMTRLIHNQESKLSKYTKYTNNTNNHILIVITIIQLSNIGLNQIRVLCSFHWKISNPKPPERNCLHHLRIRTCTTYCKRSRRLISVCVFADYHFLGLYYSPCAVITTPFWKNI